MRIERQHLHHVIDIVEERELAPLYYLLCKFIPEDIASPEEEEAILSGREQIARGEYVRMEDVDWGD